MFHSSEPKKDLLLTDITVRKLIRRMNILSNLALFCFVLSSLTSPITIHQSRFGETTFNSPSDLSWRQLWFDEIQVFDAHYVEKGSQAIYGRSISYFRYIN
ncbi:MAG: hypothetical protein ACXAB7_01505 [Candidatus Kariarchaeaceae archaeon]